MEKQRINKSIIIRRAGFYDSKRLSEIDCACFPPEQSSSEEAFTTFTQNPSIEIFVAEVNGYVAGYSLFFLQDGSSDELKLMDNEDFVFQIGSIAVDPAYRGYGVAHQIMSKSERILLEEYKTSSHRFISEISPNNQSSLGLFLSLGYSQTEKLDNYYGQGKSALRFEKTLVEPTFAKFSLYPNINN